MNSLTDLTAQPKRFVVDGKEYKLHSFTLNDFAELQTWIDAQFPDPFAVVHAEFDRREYNVAQQQFMLEKAIEKSTRPRRLIGTPEADQLLQTIEGAKRMLFMAIRKGDPSFSEEDADALCGKVSVGDLAFLYGASAVQIGPGDPRGDAGRIAAGEASPARSLRKSGGRRRKR